MDMLQYIGPASGLLFTLENILWVNLGVLVGAIFAACLALLISDGSPKIFFSSIFCWIFIALIAIVLFTLVRGKLKEAKAKKEEENING